MKLYDDSTVARSLAAHIAARIAGVEVDLVKVDLRTRRLDDGTDCYSINLRGHVPARRLDDGTLLKDVAAIVQYLGDRKPESGLVPPAARWRACTCRSG